MSHELWTHVDQYITETLIPSDPAMEQALRDNAVAQLPSIDVTPSQGKLLYLLALMQGAKSILEIGTLGGYSTIWLAKALPADGKLVTLEVNPKHAKVASANIARAGFSSRVEVKLGPALESLAKLAQEGTIFDMIFIDADKPNNAVYLDWALRLSRPGTVILGDNVVREGEILDPASSDPTIQGTRRFFEHLAAEPRLEATAIQTVGSKGYDGFALARVK